jgi:hypothetical protein
MLIFNLSRIFSCQSFQMSSVSFVNRDEFKSFWDCLLNVKRIEVNEVTFLVTCSWCCASVNLFWNVWFNWFNRFFAQSISSKWVFHICLLDILSNNSQAFIFKSRWVQRLFKSSRNTSESCLTQCCNCFTFFIFQKIEAFRNSLKVWEWDKDWQHFYTKLILRYFDMWSDNFK